MGVDAVCVGVVVVVVVVGVVASLFFVVGVVGVCVCVGEWLSRFCPLRVGAVRSSTALRQPASVDELGCLAFATC